MTTNEDTTALITEEQLRADLRKLYPYRLNEGEHK